MKLKLSVCVVFQPMNQCACCKVLNVLCLKYFQIIAIKLIILNDLKMGLR